MCLLWLTFYRVANVFDCFSNFAARLAEAFFNFASGMFGAAFGFEFIVVENSADSLFSLSFCLIPFSFNFIFVW